MRRAVRLTGKLFIRAKAREKSVGSRRTPLLRWISLRKPGRIRNRRWSISAAALRVWSMPARSGLPARSPSSISRTPLLKSEGSASATRASSVRWVVSDVTTWRAEAAAFDIWHDRATFHFLTDARDRARYVERLRQALKPGGHAPSSRHSRWMGRSDAAVFPVVRYDGPASTRGDRGRLRARLDASPSA